MSVLSNLVASPEQILKLHEVVSQGGGSKTASVKNFDIHKSGNVMPVNYTQRAHVFQASVSVILVCDDKGKDKRVSAGLFF